MLSARYLAGCSDDLVRLYSQLEADIITNMAKRLKKLEPDVGSAEYQSKILREIGSLQSDIKNYISKYDKDSQKMILQLFDEASRKATENDIKAYKHGERNLSENQEQVLRATAKKIQSTAIVNSNKKTRKDFAEGNAIKVFSSLQRLTMTIADTASGDFVTKANQAYMQVASGAFTYDEALKSSVDDLAKMGVHTVEYTDSGHLIKRTIEGAVRTNIVTGLNQTVAQITLDNCEDLGTSLVEVSAHVGARPEHAEWQGKIYSLNGPVYNDDGTLKYADFYSTCHPGEPTGICGINCRHSYYPYFEGSEPMYSEGRLDELKDATVKYDGQELTRYDAEQQLRLYERAIRKWKLRADAEQSAGIDNTDSRIRLGEWQRKAQDFTNKTGLRRDYAREYVGTASGKQPSGLPGKEVERKYNNSISLNGEKSQDPIVTRKFPRNNSNFSDTSIIAGAKKGNEIPLDNMLIKNIGTVNPSGDKHNCQTTVMCALAKVQGYNLVALPKGSDASIVLSNDLSIGFVVKNTNMNPIREPIKDITSPRTLYNEINKKIGKNQIYAFSFLNRNNLNGHVVWALRTNDNQLMFIETQTMRGFSSEKILLQFIQDNVKLKQSYIPGLMRIDNCTLNLNIANEVLKLDERK